MFRAVENRMIVPNVHLLSLEAPEVARAIQPGQFVIVRVDEEGERIPLSIADWDAEKGTVTVGVLNVGMTTGQLASIPAGSSIPTVVGPLGNATEIEDYGTVLLIGGCYGIGSLYPIARALKAEGNKVIMVMEGRSSYLLYWEDRYEALCDKVIRITRDGSKGYRGHVKRLPEILSTLGEKVDRIIINGCTFLMKKGSEASKPLGIPTVVSLNPLMIDGTGMCGVCRVTVGAETRFACVHGPDFDGHQVDWIELAQRRKSYLGEEVIPLRRSSCKGHCRKTGGA